jgi:hypothetical protein
VVSKSTVYNPTSIAANSGVNITWASSMPIQL